MKPFENGLTFERDGHDLVLGIGVLKHTFGAEHFLITLAKEFHFFRLVYVTILNSSIFRRRGTLTRVRIHLSHG